MKKIANKSRIDILKMVYNAKSGHIGGAYSCIDILTVLYDKILNIPREWDKSKDFEKRDRFVLSKGHASAALYATLANFGFFPKDMLMGFRIMGSKLQGHPSSKMHLAGVETSAGSLGQGLSIGVGMALGLRLDNNKDSKVFVLMGDGEMQEGSVWEALMNASSKKLDNLVVIVDKNRLQIDGETKNVKNIDPLDKKLEAFGFRVYSIDGHNYEEIEKTLAEVKKSNELCAIIANTIKGKGVSFMENNASWHGKVPTQEEYSQALEELNAN